MKTIRLLVFIISSILCSCSTSIEPLDPSIVLPTAENPSPNPSPTPTWSNDAFPVNTSAILKVDVNGVTTIFGNIQGLKSITIPPLSTNEPPVIAYQIGGTIGTTFPLTNLNIQFLDEGIGTYPIELPELNSVSLNEVLSVQTINIFTTTNLSNLSENYGAINVSSNNEIDKFISGNFNAKIYKIVQPPATTTETKNLTNGLFTNIDYVTSNNTNIFKYKINNVPFPGNNPDASSTGYYQKNNVKWLKTLSDGYENVSFGIKNDIVVGSYPLSLNPADMINGFYKINGILYKATSGTVKITAVSASSISGIFNFSATNAAGTQTVVISEGEFSLFK